MGQTAFPDVDLKRFSVTRHRNDGDELCSITYSESDRYLVTVTVTCYKNIDSTFDRSLHTSPQPRTDLWGVQKPHECIILEPTTRGCVIGCVLVICLAFSQFSAHCMIFNASYTRFHTTPDIFISSSIIPKMKWSFQCTFGHFPSSLT